MDKGKQRREGHIIAVPEALWECVSSRLQFKPFVLPYSS